MRPLRAGRFSAIALSVLAFGVAVPRSLAGADETAAPTSAEADSSTNDPESSAPPHRLAYRFRPGQQSRYVMDVRSTMEVRKGEAIQIISNATETTRRFHVVSVEEDGSAWIEPVIERVRMMVRFDDAEPTRFDSVKDGPAPRQFQEVDKSVGKRAARLRITPQGELLDIVRLDANGDPIQQKSDEPGDKEKTEDQEAEEDQVVSAEQEDPAEEKAPADQEKPVFQADENILALLPKEAIPVGHVWKERFTAPVRVDRNIERTATLQREFVLRKVEGNVATIGVRIAIITPIADPAILAQLVLRTPSGTIEFDIERGEILSRTMDQDQTIYGAIGPTSSLRAASKLTERRLEPESEPAQRTADTTSPRS